MIQNDNKEEKKTGRQLCRCGHRLSKHGHGGRCKIKGCPCNDYMNLEDKTDTMDIEFRGQPTLEDILEEAFNDMASPPKAEGLAYMKKWSLRVTPKYVRSLVLAGAYYAKKYPDRVIVRKVR